MLVRLQTVFDILALVIMDTNTCILYHFSKVQTGIKARWLGITLTLLISNHEDSQSMQWRGKITLGWFTFISSSAVNGESVAENEVSIFDSDSYLTTTWKLILLINKYVWYILNRTFVSIKLLNFIMAIVSFSRLSRYNR